MDLTQKDFDERKQRAAAGNATDEDRRLIEHYEAEGYEWGGNSSERPDNSTQNNSSENGPDSRSTASSTGTPSKQGSAKGRSTASGADASSI